MNRFWQRNITSGFTIVELLIVIVVIAILAAIGVVAYNGIQSRTNDAAVQSDLRNLAMKIEEYYAVNGVYPSSADSTVIGGGVSYHVNRIAYETGAANLYYCAISSGNDAKYSIAALSKSGQRFVYRQGGFADYSGGWNSSSTFTTICSGAGISTTAQEFSYAKGYSFVNSAWSSWTN